MKKTEFKDLPKSLRKEILMQTLLDGKELTLLSMKAAFDNKGIHTDMGYSSQIAELLDIEDELQEFRNEFDETFHKFSRSILKKVQAFSKEQGFATVETDKDGNILWPDKPTSFKIDLEENDD